MMVVKQCKDRAFPSVLKQQGSRQRQETAGSEAVMEASPEKDAGCSMRTAVNIMEAVNEHVDQLYQSSL